jgi:hypothetical protein
VNKGVDKELSDKHGLLLEMYDERAFSRDAIRELPEQATELRAEENLLHVLVAVLDNAVLREARRNSVRLTPKIFAFLEQAFYNRAPVQKSPMRFSSPLLKLLNCRKPTPVARF